MDSFDRVVRTVCSPNCTGTCGVNAYVRGDRIVKLEPADYPDPRYRRICLKGISMATERVHAPNRLTHPLRRKGPRGGGEWEVVSWEEALGAIAAELERIAGVYGPPANAWISMTGNSGLKALLAPLRAANSLGGTTFTNVGLMGDCGCGMGLKTVFGTKYVAQRYEDLVGAKLVILLAKNIADTAHSEMHFLFDAMEAGARVVAVDPRFSRTAAKADQWIAPRPGTDTALLLGMINVIVAEGLHDATYLARHTNAPFLVRGDNHALLRTRDIWPDGDDDFVVWDSEGRPATSRGVPRPRLSGGGEILLASGRKLAVRTAWDALCEAWAPFNAAAAADICELPVEVITDLAREYARTDPAAIILGQGAQRYYNGHLAFRAAATLGGVCGKIGKPHGGVNWADGPLLRLLYSLTPESEWIAPAGSRGPVQFGTRMLDMIASADPYPIRSLWITNYGFATQSSLFRRFVNEALPKLDLFVVTEQVMTPAAQHADFVLPCVSYYEEELDIVGGAEHWFVQLRQRVIAPVGESKSDWEIFRDLLTRMGKGTGWEHDAETVCRRLIDEHPDPLMRSVSWERLRREGAVEVELPRPYVPFADQVFPTASGRLELYSEQLSAFGQDVLRYEEPLEGQRRARAQTYPLTLITHHQVHTTHAQHTTLRLIREQMPEPLLDIHPKDAAKRGLHDRDLVRVFNDRGAFKVKINVTEGIRPGTVNIGQGWWPEHFVEGHYTNVQQLTPSPVQDAIVETNYAIFDNLVEVERTQPPASPQVWP